MKSSHKNNLANLQSDIFTISYVCDIEGNLDYWNRFVSISRVIHRKSDGKIALKKNCHLIFGGDACDRGPGDIRILEDLLQLHDDNPQNVHFINGNRDVNKMRLPFELNAENLLKEPPQVFWVKRADQNTPKTKPETKAERLKWILNKTMGAPGAFEYRRQELRELNLPHEDDDIVNSFLDLVKPDGGLTRYLKISKLALIFGDTIFVHGALHSYNSTFVPQGSGEKTSGDGKNSCTVDDSSGAPPNLEEWLDALNKFSLTEATKFQEQGEEYLQKMRTDPGQYKPWSHVGNYGHEQPGSSLVQCGMAAYSDMQINPSVIYSSYMKDGQPLYPDEGLVEYLNYHGIHRIVVGHQPIGDVPLVLRTCIPAGSLQIICCDTSYAKDVVWSGDSEYKPPSVIANVPFPEEFPSESQIFDETPHHLRPPPPESSRGVAVSELCVQVHQKITKMMVHGILSSGVPYEYEIPGPSDSTSDVGTLLLNEWLVRAIITDPPFSVEYQKNESMDDEPSTNHDNEQKDLNATPSPFDLRPPAPPTAQDMAHASTIGSQASTASHSLASHIVNDKTKAYYLISRHEGYKVINRIVSSETLQDLKIQSIGLPPPPARNLAQSLLNRFMKVFASKPADSEHSNENHNQPHNEHRLRTATNAVSIFLSGFRRSRNNRPTRNSNSQDNSPRSSVTAKNRTSRSSVRMDGFGRGFPHPDGPPLSMHHLGDQSDEGGPMDISDIVLEDPSSPSTTQSDPHPISNMVEKSLKERLAKVRRTRPDSETHQDDQEGGDVSGRPSLTGSATGGMVSDRRTSSVASESGGTNATSQPIHDSPHEGSGRSKNFAIATFLGGMGRRIRGRRHE